MIFPSLKKKKLQGTFQKELYKFLNKYRIPQVNLQINNLEAAIFFIHKSRILSCIS